MNTPKEIVADWSDTCEALALEYWESNSDQDASEYAHECADSCQWAIYYGHAHELVNAARLLHPRDIDQAEFDLGVMGYEFESLDKTMTLLAYQLTFSEIMTQIQEQESEND